jgi:hypothetical protein
VTVNPLVLYAGIKFEDATRARGNIVDTHHRRQTIKREASGAEILLERQGTMWEGSGKKQLPAWMTKKGEMTEKQALISRTLWACAGRYIAIILGLGTKP